MSDIRFARKAQDARPLESGLQNPPLICLLRVMFDLPDDGDTQRLDAQGIAWEGPDYSPKEFMAYLNISQWAIYKWLDKDSPVHFPAQYLADFAVFVREKSGGTDQRLAHYIADLCGYGAKVREIERIIKNGGANV